MNSLEEIYKALTINSQSLNIGLSVIGYMNHQGQSVNVIDLLFCNKVFLFCIK